MTDDVQLLGISNAIVDVLAHVDDDVVGLPLGLHEVAQRGGLETAQAFLAVAYGASCFLMVAMGAALGLVVMAAMPVAVARHCVPPSRAARFSSRAARVGLPLRV